MFRFRKEYFVVKSVTLLLTISLLTGSCASKDSDSVTGKNTYYILSSRAGIPSQQNGMDELKPFEAEFSYEENAEGLLDLSLRYQFVKSDKSASNSFTISIPNVPVANGKKRSVNQSGLSGCCSFNEERSDWEDITIQGALNQSFLIEGTLRSFPFRLEILSMTSSADKAVSHIIDVPLIQQMTCWEEILRNGSDRYCEIDLTTGMGSDIHIALSPGESWRQYIYGDVEVFWGGFCSKVTVAPEGSPGYTLSGAKEIIDTISDSTSPFHLCSEEKDWYLYANPFGELVQYPYLRQQIEIL